MPNKKTVALTKTQYEEIITAMRTGSVFFRPNNRIATCLVLEANLGLRIEDILQLKTQDIIRDGNRYRLDIAEQKTGKQRVFTVPVSVFQYIDYYRIQNSLKPDDLLFNMTERAVQKYLKKVVDFLGYENIGTHSFRKFFATEIYINNNYDVKLVQQLLQHSSVAITQRYIGIQSEQIEAALLNHTHLL